MAQLFIVSNRLPFSVKKIDGKLVFQPSVSGLATGLSSYVQDRRSIWVGWPGIADEDCSEQDKRIITKELAKHQCTPVFLSKRQIDNFYNGYSNSILWPLLHGMPIRQGARHEEWWKGYRAVNKLYAETVLSLAQPDSTIWVHDYQLLLMPELLRAEHVSGHIGFFLHTPFPSAKIFGKLQAKKQLLRGMLGADLIGFHTAGYSTHFVQACEAFGWQSAAGQEIIAGRRRVKVTHFPIGVDYEKYAEANKLKAVKQTLKLYRRLYGKRKIIVSVDRLEPAKGLTERLRAYRDFLATNPRLRGKVIFVMVVAPSRMDVPAYQRLKIQLEKLRDEINGAYGTARWQPLDLINQALPFEAVSALYQLADIAFIAPLRDGMNLVAKEFVASKRKSGVLILSETAGAAEELRDALLVNPKDPAALTAALERAVTMPRRELRSRLRGMQGAIAGNTIQAWAGTFVTALHYAVPDVKRHVSYLQGKLLTRLLHDYAQAKKRLLLLDYDGTLVPFTEDFESSKQPKATIALLRQLSKDPANDVVIISGRQAADLDAWFDGLKLHIVAEHGAVIKMAGTKRWETIEPMDTAWKKTLLPILGKYTALTPRAAIEVKPHSLVWHYRAAPPYYAQKYVVVIKHVLKPWLKKYGLHILQGNKILEIKDPAITKGQAVHRWLASQPDFVLAIGDDATDEDLFERLGDTAFSIKVGSGRTAAVYRLKTTDEVVNLLKQLR